jgi:hypothetical protein
LKISLEICNIYLIITLTNIEQPYNRTKGDCGKEVKVDQNKVYIYLSATLLLIAAVIIFLQH